MASRHRCALGAWLLVAPLAARGQDRIRLEPVRGLDEYVAIPDDNPLTLRKVELGRHLFFDQRLSRDSSISCASCHRPEHAFADTASRSRGIGGRVGRRNVPTIVNRAYGLAFFWDGRERELEHQSLQPIQDSTEMGLSIAALLVRLRSDTAYRSAFGRTFHDGLTATNVGRALASYVRTIRSGDAPFDRYRDGDTTAFSAQAKRGAALFFGKANCSTCHVGPNFTDEKFHNTGVASSSGDRGRFDVTGRRVDFGAFKTPTLRDVARTAPYMHDGSKPTLDAVVDFYERGGSPNANLDAEIRPLGLSAEDKRDLVAFLRSLTGSVP